MKKKQNELKRNRILSFLLFDKFVRDLFTSDHDRLRFIFDLIIEFSNWKLF